MKTTTNNINFPGTAKFFAFVVLISGLAFLSCMVTKAQVSNQPAPITFINQVDESYADVLKSTIDLTGLNTDQVWAARLERALVAETESNPEVEAWMVDAEYTAEASPELETWMLDTEFSAGVFEESEEAIAIEAWMLDAGYFTVAQTDEEPLELEDWMIE